MAGNAYWDTYGQATNAFAVGQQTAQRQREAAIADQQRQTALAAGNAFAGGDYTGAANAYARGGDVGNAGKVLDWQAAQAKAQRDQQLAVAQQQADVTLKGLRALRTAPPDQRGALFASSIAPILRQRGIPQEGIDHIASIAGNDAALDAEATALGQAQAKWTHNVVNGSLVASNDQQAAAQEVFRGQRPPKYVNVPAGGQATMVDPGTPGGVVGPGGALQGQEAPPAPVVTPAPPGPSAGPISYAPPVQGMRVPAGGGFGAPRDGHVHHGEDFAVPIGTPVAASAEGVVTPFTGQRGDYGNVVEVRHPDGSVTRYAHLGQINVQPGQAVRQGDVLGASGQSGNATGPTLHFEIRQRGQAVNPAPALAGQPYQVAQNGPPRTIQGPPKADPNEGNVDLSPDTVDYVAQQYMLTGQLPPLGMGKAAAANRDRILNRAAAIERETGATGADAVTRHLTVKSAAAGLTAITRIRGQVESFESTAEKNADLVLQLAPKGGSQTNIPVLNRWLQAGRQNLAGDPDVAAFHAALQGLVNEYGKIISGATGGAVTSDSARHEAQGAINGAQTQDQLRAVIAQIKAEMKNRITSLREQEAAYQETIRNGGTAPPKAPGGHPLNNDPRGQIGASADGYPIFTREQALEAAKLPENKGHHFYLQGQSGLQEFH